MGKKPKVRATPQSLAQAIVKRIEALDILDNNRYVRGAAGELEAIQDRGVGGAAGRYEKRVQGEEPQKKISHRYRARFTLRFIDYPAIGHLEKFLTKHAEEFNGEYTFGKHPLTIDDERMRLISLEESGEGHHATQRKHLMDDLKTLDKILEAYAETFK